MLPAAIGVWSNGDRRAADIRLSSSPGFLFERVAAERVMTSSGRGVSWAGRAANARPERKARYDHWHWDAHEHVNGALARTIKEQNGQVAGSPQWKLPPLT
jgi:hypothetical protein